MRPTKLMIPAICIALAACSEKAAVEGDNATETSVASEATEQADISAGGMAQRDAAPPPRISANVAPGVAFDFRYSFGLPEDRISKAQEAHASLCEKLGIIHCRVTGMNYAKSDGGDVQASLAFKLNPAMAHSFGRDATELVEREEGSLTDSVITGEDVGSQIVAGDKSTAGINAELAKIDAQLKIPNLSKQVRGQLVEQAATLREQLRALASDRDTKVESLATTPVQFSYHSNEVILGFDNRSPVQQALRTGSTSFSTMISFVLLVVGGLAPWALLGGAIFWLVRRLRPAKIATSETE
jgi:Domain of unknown function (DUF4349)